MVDRDMDSKIRKILLQETRRGSKLVVFLFGIAFPIIFTVATLILMFFEQRPVSEITTADLIVKAIPYFFLLIGVEFATCKLLHYDYYRLNDSISSLSAGVFNQVFSMLTKSALVFPYAYLHEHYAIYRLPADTWWSWLLMFLCVEYGYYWAHRACHEVNILWIAHAAHHNSEEYNLTTALRQAIFQPWASFFFYMPFALFFPVPLFTWHNQFNTLYQFWIHTRVIRKLGIFEWIFNTPSHHRVHHGRNSQYIDKNYGGTLIIFDRLFKTFEPEKEEAIFGITHELGTWDPFVAQFHHVTETFEVMNKTPGLINKIRTWIELGPGYNYWVSMADKPEGYVDPATSLDRPKYDSNPPNFAMSLYGFIHFTVALSEAAVVFSIADNLSTMQTILYSIAIVYSMWSILAIFDQKSYCIWTEVVRNVISSTMIYSLATSQNLTNGNDWLRLSLLAFSLVSVAWIMYFYRIKPKEPKAKSS